MNCRVLFFLVTLVSFNSSLVMASTKRKKSEDEPKGNSLNYYYTELMTRPASLVTSMFTDATIPVFLVLGAASLASVYNEKTEGVTAVTGAHGRSKRSSPSAAWTSNILKVLNNVQKAVEKYQHLEDEFINDLDESVKREFEVKVPE